MCYCTIDDGPEIYEESYPIARKKHICCECGSDIDIGEKYYKIRGKWNGDFSTFKQCLICRDVWEKAIGDFDCIGFECLWETVGVEYEL